MGAVKIKKPTDLRKDLFETLDQSVKGAHFLIPHRTGETVLLGKEDYDRLVEDLETSKSIQQGMLDYFENRTLDLSSVNKHFESKFKKWLKKR